MNGCIACILVACDLYFSRRINKPQLSIGGWLGEWLRQGGLATASDLAAFRLSMIAPVKKSVNHSRTVASMRETGWEQQQEVRLRSDSTVWSEFAFGPVGHSAFFAVTNFFFRGNVELTFSFLLVLRLSLHAVYYAIKERDQWTVIVHTSSMPDLFKDSLHLSRCRLSSCVSV